MSFIDLPLTGASAYWANAVNTAAALPVSGAVTGESILVLDTLTYYAWNGSAWAVAATMAGPASSTDNAVARYDGATGKTLQNSAVTIDDTGNIVTVGTVDGVDVSTLPGLITTAQTTANNAATAAATAQTTADTKITGAASSTDEALVRFDGAGGKTGQNSAVTLSDAGGMTFTGTTGFLRLPNLTTVQRDALTGAEGMIVFNTTDSRFQGYFAGAWANLHGWGS